MNGYYGHSTTPVVIAQSASLSTYATGIGVVKFAIEVPTFASGLANASSDMYIQVAQNPTDTFRRLYTVVANSGSTAGLAIPWSIGSCTGNFNTLCEQLSGYKYFKIELTTAVTLTSGFTINVHCMQ